MTTNSNPRETKSSLSRRLKIHRAQLDTLLAQSGAPAPDARKCYAVAEVVAFISAARTDSALDTLRSARLREVILRCTKLQRELDRDANLVVSVADVSAMFKRYSTVISGELYAGVESHLAPRLDGQPSVAAKKILQEWADALVDKINGMIFSVNRDTENFA